MKALYSSIVIDIASAALVVVSASVRAWLTDCRDVGTGNVGAARRSGAVWVFGKI